MKASKKPSSYMRCVDQDNLANAPPVIDHFNQPKVRSKQPVKACTKSIEIKIQDTPKVKRNIQKI